VTGKPMQLVVKVLKLDCYSGYEMR